LNRRNPEVSSMVKDAMALKRIDHVRMFVGNARQSAYFYRNAFGFEVIAYAGLETGVRHEACYVLRQGDITFVLASPLRGDHPDAQRLVQHGDGVQSIALEVDDVTAAFEAAVSRGAQPAVPPRTIEDDFGAYEIAEIHAYGDTTHSLVDRSRYHGIFAPGFKPLDPDRYNPRTFHPVGLRVIDHIVANVEEGKMADWVDYYSKVMGFSLLASFDDKDISTDYSALMSKVVTDGRGRIKFPINEPAKGRRRSQIEEFLDFYGGPGVQHIALATADIVASVRAMVANDVSFLKVPPAYYDLLPDRVGTIREDIRELAELGILVDRDEEGYLLQIFTKPVEDRPTLFFEIIQRRGARSFGKGNFKALFEAIELEQSRRGTL
jgi:4-hydroxyphenylpyruvate dioxygenase